MSLKFGAMINELIRTVRTCFSDVKDHRSKNCTYALTDVLMSAFAIFHLKDDSVLAFREEFKARENNLKRVYGLSEIPEDTSLRGCLDGVTPSSLKPVFKILLDYAGQHGLLQSKLVMNKYLAVSIDGTEHYCSSKTSCKQCMTKTYKDGHQNFYHQMLAAVIVHPEQSTVFPVYCEAIVVQDGAQKNDCERNACKRLLPTVREMLPEAAFADVVVLCDALYTDGPTILAFQAQNMHFMTTVKEGYILVQVEHLTQKGELKTYRWSDDKMTYEVKYAENLILNGVHQEISVNYVELQQRDKKTQKLVYRNTWITDLPIIEPQLPELVQLGRARWKIENETFNTLKTQGYNLEHNYGHGKQYLCTVFAMIMFAAFFVDQIAQAADDAFKKACGTFKTKKAFWNAVRHIFYLVPVMSMNDVYKIIAKDIFYDIRLRV